MKKNLLTYFIIPLFFIGSAFSNEKQAIVSNENIQSTDNTLREENNIEQKDTKNNEDITTNKTTNEISTEDKGISQKRVEILENFRKKLLENQQIEQDINKIQIDSIDDGFAVIIEKEIERREAELKEKEKEKEKEKNLVESSIKQSDDKEIVEIANQPILEEEILQEHKKEEKEVEKTEKRNKYIEKLKNSIANITNKQGNNFKKITIQEYKIKKEKDIIPETEIKPIIETEQGDNEIFNINDSGISEEFINSDEFYSMLQHKNLATQSSDSEDAEKTSENDTNNEQFIPIPVEKNINTFKTSDIPEELLSPHRSKENKHIPLILNMEDFQFIAKRSIDNNSLDVLRGIVDVTKNPDYMLNNGQTILNYASSMGTESIARYLIYSGANLNIQDHLGNTALHNAILRNDAKMIKLLVGNGADLEIINVDGYTPLMLSIVENYDSITLFLLKYKQNLLLKNYKEETILDIAGDYNKTLIKEIILKILEEENTKKM